MSRKPTKGTSEAPTARTQRSIAGELGISRTKLKRLLAHGLPARRHGDKFVMDMDAASAWIEQHEGAGRALAPVLHPDDPRHRERTAAAAIRQIEADARRGAIVRMDDVLRRFHDEIGALRHMLLAIPAQFTIPVDDIEGALAGAIEDALAELQADVSSLWPKPLQGVQIGHSVEARQRGQTVPSVEDGDWLEQGAQNGPPVEVNQIGSSVENEPSGQNAQSVERDTLPLLLPGDPRHAFASAQADIKESKLAEAQAGVVPVADALAMIRESYSKIRERLRAVPFAVALALEDDASVFDVVRYQIYDAMGEISGDRLVCLPEVPSANIDVHSFDDVNGQVSVATRSKLETQSRRRTTTRHR